MTENYGVAKHKDSVQLKENGFTREEIKQVSEIHVREIKDGFLTSLGCNLLELVYSSISESKSSTLILAIDEKEGCVCGFICGTSNLGVLYKDFIRKHFFAAMVHLAPRLVSFASVKKIFETLLYPSKKEFSDMPKAELFNFAISEKYQGKGVAKKLFLRLADVFRGMGIENFKIGTGENLTRAQQFYEKMGAKKIDSIEIHKGQKSFIYTYCTANKVLKES